MRYLSVCSGIEAASVAWHPLGWTPAAFSEIEPFPRAVLAHRFPGVPLHGDFTTIRGDEYGPVDLLVGGTPCQSFSVAGLRKGMEDERGNLALEYLRLASRLNARWLVWENVPGVLSSNGGRDFGAFLGGLAQLGYGFAYRVLDAQYFGVPQRRRRVFVVGYLGDWRRSAAVLFERHSLQGHPAPSREAGERAAAGTLRSTDGGCDVDHARAGHLVGYRETGQGWWSEGLMGLRATPGGVPSNVVARTITARKGKGPNSDCDSGNLVIAHTLRADGFDASEDGTGRGTPLVPVAFSCKDHGADAGEVAPTLRSMGHDGSHPNGGGQVAVAFGGQMSTPQVDVELSQTLQAKNPQAVSTSMAVRRILPVECERLQGFPDNYTLVPYRSKPAADGNRYKALGNSFAVPVVRWIGERIQMVEDLCKSTSAKDAA